MKTARYASLALVLALAFTGCSKDDDNPVAPQVQDTGIPDSVALATTPANLMNRIDAAYTYEDDAEYAKLLSADYRLTFSSQADPELVVVWGDTWDREDELASMTHLLAGFTDDQGQYWPALASITIAFEGTSFVSDSTHADSTDHYKVAVVPRLRSDVTLSDGAMFQIDAPHRLYLVRGDAAVLVAGQEARADRWYIRRWVDQAPALSLAPENTTPVTWGGIKHTYR